MTNLCPEFTTPTAFFEYAQDDPTRWERLKGRRVHHCERGVGRVDSIVLVTYVAEGKKFCDGFFVVFDNDGRRDRFNTDAFADGTFTAFGFETEVLLQHIRDALSRLDLSQAAHLRDSYKPQIEQTSFDYEATVKPYFFLCDLLRNHDFQQADDFVARRNLVVAPDAYQQTKANWLIDYFHRTRHQKIDRYKGIALAKLDGNILVTARAGSGKTTLLTHLASLLVDRYGVDPHAILVLAFNREAAKEIRGRIAKDLQLPTFHNARTFHSLAHQLVRPSSDILYDANDETIPGDLSKFVEGVLRSIWNPAFQAEMHVVFRAELQEMERSGSLLSDSDYLTFRRNLSHITLANEHVKSAGEKIIADFLFEHDIKYTYEKPVFWGGSVYRPDFTMFDGTKDIVIEHWALDPDDPRAKLPPHWTTTATEYRNQIEEKRKFWRARGAVLLETSTRDLVAGREAFERRLESLIRGAGMPCNRVDEKTLERKVVVIHRNRMTKLFVQFIQKCKKQLWTAEDVAARAKTYQTGNDREKVFIRLAVRVYSEYEKALAHKNLLDFDVLMESAVTVLSNADGRCSVRFGQQEISLPDLRWILIDEYQDFSPQFFALLQSVRQHNPQVRFFCVGDDWQAINRFAGSDLCFFHGFVDHFQEAAVAVLPTNYRSRKAIVEAGNRVMQGRGTPGEWLPDKHGGELYERNVDKIWIELRTADQYAKDRDADKKFRFIRILDDGREVSDDAGEIVARYLKCVHEIVTEQRNLGKTVALLSPINRLHHLSQLTVFVRKLKACFTSDQVQSMGGADAIDRNIRIGTVHSFKGLEADIVFVLRACQGAFPLVHPDYVLFGLFGDTEQQTLEEQRRLFYVAVTRGREQVWFLTETDRQSDFVKEIIGDENAEQQRGPLRFTARGRL
jgi:DNA helicase-4